MVAGRYGRASGTLGQYIRGVELNFVEPYFLDQRISGGVDLFARQTLASPYLSYGSSSYGTNLKMGVPLREDLAFQMRSSYWTYRLPRFAVQFVPGGIISMAHTAVGRMYIEARKFPFTSHASGVRNQ